MANGKSGLTDFHNALLLRLVLTQSSSQTSYHRNQLIRFHWFRDVSAVTGKDRAHTILDARVGRERYRWQRLLCDAFLFPYLTHQSITVHLRHTDVTNQNVEVVLR